MGEEVTPKRSPKRRGPAKKYVPETTDVSPAKKPCCKAIPKKGAKATVQVTTATAPRLLQLQSTLPL